MRDFDLAVRESLGRVDAELETADGGRPVPNVSEYMAWRPGLFDASLRTASKAVFECGCRRFKYLGFGREVLAIETDGGRALRLECKLGMDRKFPDVQNHPGLVPATRILYCDKYIRVTSQPLCERRDRWPMSEVADFLSRASDRMVKVADLGAPNLGRHPASSRLVCFDLGCICKADSREEAREYNSRTLAWHGAGDYLY